MNKKQVIRCVIFLSLVVILVGCLCRLFKYKNDWNSGRFVTLRSLKPGEMDAIYVGTSAVDRYWNCAQAFEEYGLAIYPVSADGALAWAHKYMIEEALNYQDPKLVIIDIRAFTGNVRNDSLSVMSRLTSGLPFYSLPRWKTVYTTEKVMYQKKDSGFDQRFDINYYLTIGQFHPKWEDPNFSLSEFKEVPSDTLGFYIASPTVKTLSSKEMQRVEAYVPSTNYEKLDPFMQTALDDLLAYLENKPFQVLFLDAPRHPRELYGARANTVKKQLEEHGYDCYILRGNEMGEYSLDPRTDYYNLTHVNYEGSKKYTRFLSSFLLERYDFFKDHRKDKDISDFEGVLAHIEERVAEEQAAYEKRMAEKTNK